MTATARAGAGLGALEQRYARLPEALHAPVQLAPLARPPQLLRLNRTLAERLGLDPQQLATAESIEVLAGQRAPAASRPLAMAYAGHQFGHFVPRLGDGRALLLGELSAPDGTRHEIHLKGSGRTQFSRGGDGRAGLGPVLREYIVSEAMAGLGIPTTRSLAIVTTGEAVVRELGVEPGAVLARTARSHVRVGTFEYLAQRGEPALVRALADHVIERWQPQLASAPNPYLALLQAAIGAQAELIARWMLVGFIHGVMNTDNCSVVGETIDYGPCAFMDTYHPATVYSSIDRRGRYAYDQQPAVGLWNLARFAETLLPLLAPEQPAAIELARSALDGYAAHYQACYESGLLRKLGLAERREGDRELAQDWLERMATQRADFTLAFRALCELRADDPSGDAAARALFAEPPSFDAWAVRWRERLRAEGHGDAERRAAMRAVNPAFIARNHRVQQAIAAAVNEGDLGPLENLLEVLQRPWDDHSERKRYALAPQPHEIVERTFCGT